MAKAAGSLLKWNARVEEAPSKFVGSMEIVEEGGSGVRER
jgi:hypothetical protein